MSDDKKVQPPNETQGLKDALEIVRQQLDVYDQSFNLVAPEWLTKLHGLIVSEMFTAPPEPKCGVCIGKGDPGTGKPCICGGSGLEMDEVIGLRGALHELDKENEKLRELVRFWEGKRMARDRLGLDAELIGRRPAITGAQMRVLAEEFIKNDPRWSQQKVPGLDDTLIAFGIEIRNRVTKGVT